ncbi:MAG: polysaccharide pyruvyl transferase family protein [Desulfocapsa sp.]|nr:polysaccharide pyruvyl transferase family protein [Desulfocapsa sp.]MBN4063998.1 polysaccharide pyruvyl transferase family protein [bacterium AH-315-I07]
MKKVGILTFHKAHNYGAVLQVAALICFLKNQGYAVEAVNYLSPPNRRYRLILFFKRRNVVKLLWETLFLFGRRYLRHRAFERFMSTYVIHSQAPVKEKNDLKGLDYDAYVVGSDQVWNTDITAGFDDIYWGNFSTEKPARKISYAASSENYPYDRRNKEKVRKGLRNFDALSVRENAFAEYLQKVTTQEISTVVDPTLLVPSGFFENLAVPPENRGRFVLVYQVVENHEVLCVAQNIARQLDAEVIEIRSKITGMVKRKNVIETARPEEFLGYLKAAQCIVTTSFHGTAFSLIFQKSFYFVDLKNNANRSRALLNDLSLQQRVISTSDDVLFSSIDYEYPIQILRKKRKFSADFLKKALYDL